MMQDLFSCKQWMCRLVTTSLILLSLLSGAQAERPRLLKAGAGLAGVLDSDRDEILFGVLEYRPAWMYKSLRPWVGIMSSDQEFFVGGGIELEYAINAHWLLIPGAGLGCYLEDNGLKLGSHLEFKTFLELDYRFSNASRIGLRVSHLSNAGLDDRNPGAESLTILYAHPF